MAKQKLKLKKKFKVSIILVILLIISIFTFIKVRENYLYRQTNEYKLIQIGYTKKETALIEKNLNQEKINELLLGQKDENLLNLMKENHYYNAYLERYIAYQKNNKSLTTKDIIKNVNLNLDYDFYDITFPADTSLGNQIVVNKYYLLEENFVPEDLTPISTTYAWGTDNMAKKEVVNAFLEMHNAALNEENIYLMVSSSYRSYADQKTVYQRFEDLKGSYYADSIAARPGSSEHQTGLALDIFSKTNSSQATFKDSNAFTWLKNNCYKYGFILRYPEGSEEITGYNPESWHYRYVGKELALKIYSQDITLDEYYANTLY